MNHRGFQYAGAWRRFGALLIDLFLVAAVVGFGILAWITVSQETPEWGERFVSVWVTGTLTIAVLLKIVLDAELMGTPGLHLLDCLLVDARTGSAITLIQSLKRTLGILLAILPALLGLAWIFWDRRKQGWHDKLGGAVVVRDDDALKSLTELARNVS
ncbi:MAG: RDD family protein [Gammaproteobacteria bacterium]|nr:RDD family protein [Gammaproteobacteria bacterium]